MLIGASKMAATLHVVSILLKLGRSWNWFIEFSALDYPLITQDALTLSFLRLWLESSLVSSSHSQELVIKPFVSILNGHCL
ncbi:hypothetical protein HID58_060446 [Brassica napus]|uniref:Uncharacterized protein n=2 Tax=Brassica TaxID=3705 RepID=A0ABQ7ZWT4_BRANA|nr:hypothetical protein HID58_060446 [Brassica napus]